jgi:hypothetical protein
VGGGWGGWTEQPALWDNYFTRFVLGQTAFDAPIGTLTSKDQEQAIAVLEGMALVLPADKFERGNGDLNAVFHQALGWCSSNLPAPRVTLLPPSNSTKLMTLITEHNALDEALYAWAVVKWQSTWAPVANANGTLPACNQLAKTNNWPSVPNPNLGARGGGKGGLGGGGGKLGLQPLPNVTLASS